MDKPITMHVYTLCDWLSSSSSASDCDNQSVSDRVVSGMGKLFSLDHKFLTLLITTLTPSKPNVL